MAQRGLITWIFKKDPYFPESKTKPRMVVRMIYEKDSRSYQWAKFGRLGLPGFFEIEMWAWDDETTFDKMQKAWYFWICFEDEMRGDLVERNSPGNVLGRAIWNYSDYLELKKLGITWPMSPPIQVWVIHDLHHCHHKQEGEDEEGTKKLELELELEQQQQQQQQQSPTSNPTNLQPNQERQSPWGSTRNSSLASTFQVSQWFFREG